MKSWLKLLLVIGAFCLAAVAQPPPVIDREAFFGDPEIAGAQISPDGKYISFLKPLDKTRNIWVKKTEEPFSAAKPITADTKRPISGYFWSRDAKYVLYVQDQLGDENYNVYAVNPADSPAAGARVPPARNLTEAKGVRAVIYGVPKSAPDVIYAGLNDRDKAWHDLYEVRISSGQRKLLRQNTERLAGWVFDNKDQLRLAVRSAENGDTEILRVDEKGLTKIYSCGVLETCAPVRFHKDNKRVYMDDNTGAGVDLARLMLFDPGDGKQEMVESDPLKRVDFGAAMFSDLTDEMIATFYIDEKRREYWKDKTYEADYKWLQGQLPGKQVNLGSRTRDEQLWVVSATSDNDPGTTYLFDRKARKLAMQYQIYEKLDRSQLASTRPIRYKSSDGLEIPAYLTLPKGVAAKNLPLMVFPHGGPWARDGWGYHPYWQFLANRGYAVLAPNFRGSTGYGKKFLNAGNKEWGQKMQDDITWGVKHLVAEGTADPKRVGIMGGSYGGYATLAGVAFTPDVYTAAVSIVGPSNLITLMESIPPYWEVIRKTFHVRMGDPTTPEGKAQLERQSPLNSASKIRTPLMVVQGANDPRVNKAESDQIVIALRDRGFPVEYVVAPDEGHGFARPVNNLAMFTAAEKFLAKHLGGRYQEGATAEVAARLKEITVDPKTVVLARKVDPALVGAPKPETGLKPGTYRYQAKIQAGPQTINIEMVISIQEEGGAWVVTETTKTPMGEVVDVAVLDKQALTLRKRTIKQATANVLVEIKDNKATGKMSMGEKERAIDVDLGGPLFADAAGSAHAVAALPLREGYSTSYRNLDLMRQKVKLLQLKVSGSESVTVPAGTFEAYKVEISSAEGGPEKTTIWVAKDSRKPVKISSLMPEMGGATLTAELAQ
ncbi:MAG: alpha/beta fold hydrolase [Acidobacteria bacterium]|nr:alpha/beta fold hydrolase [Acidobacteriota bacterium]